MAKSESASALIDKQIADLGDWRGATYARLRTLIAKADPALAEEWKWGTAVWSRNGLVCSVGAFKDHVGINFFKGASLHDPKGVFNGGLDAKTTRSIKLREGDVVNEKSLAELVRAAVALNGATGK